MFGSVRQVNGINVEACTHDEVVTLLKQAEGPIITLAVRHFRPASHFLNKSKPIWTNHMSAWVLSGKQQIAFTKGYLCQQTMCGHGYFQLISKIISSAKVSLGHQPCEWQWMYGVTFRTFDVHSLTFRMVHVQLGLQDSWCTQLDLQDGSCTAWPPVQLIYSLARGLAVCVGHYMHGKK